MASKNVWVSVQHDDFDVGRYYNELKEASSGAGAVITFTGIVRELTKDKRIEALFLEHYPKMTEQCLLNIALEAKLRWALSAVKVVHRVGRLGLNDNIVFVGVASAHRAAGFEAAQFIMDYLKRDAPFWKKEITAEGENWVEQKQSDLTAAESWSANDV